MRAIPAVLTVLAMTVAGGPALAQTPDPNAYSGVPVTDEKVQAAVAGLDDMVAAMMKDTGIPGVAVSVVYKGVPVYQKGFGTTSISEGTPVDADTAFQVASVSKSVSASVVASVIGDGDISWDTRAHKLLPEFELSDSWVTRKTTLGDLFAMRSGLPHQAGDDLEELGYSRMQIIKRFRLLPLSPFRGQSLYTNFGLTAAAQAVARAEGVKWEKLAAKRIYEPLGMTRTTSLFRQFKAQANHATLHVKADGQWVPTGLRKEQAQAPAGQVSTTANDFAKWMIMWLNDGQYNGRQVVDKAALAQARTPRILNAEVASPNDRPSFYGYGIGLRVDATGHTREGFSGAFSQGASTHFSLVPSEDLGIAVFTNAFPIGAAEGLAYTFLDRVEFGSNPIDWMAVWAAQVSAALAPAPGPFGKDLPRKTGKASRPLKAYAGTYRNDYYGRVSVKAEAGGLIATVGPKKFPLSLVPYGGNLFASQDGTPMAKFTARTVELAVLRAPGNEVFTRVR